MKRFLLLLVSFLFFYSTLSASNSPRLYLNSFDQELFKIKIAYLDFYKVNLTEFGSKAAERSRVLLATQIQSSKTKIDQSPSFKGDNELKNSFLANLDSLETCVNKDYMVLLKLKMRRAKSSDYLENYYADSKLLEDKIIRYESHCRDALTAFLKKHDLNTRLKYSSKMSFEPFFIIEEELSAVALHYALVNERYTDLIGAFESGTTTKKPKDLTEKVSSLKELILAEKNSFAAEKLDQSLTSSFLKYLRKSSELLDKDLSIILKGINSYDIQSLEYQSTLNEISYAKDSYYSYSKNFKEELSVWLKDRIEKAEKSKG